MSAIYAIAHMMSSPAARPAPFISGSAPALPWLLPMGLRHAILSALPLLLATPALAQQQDSAPPVFALPSEQPQPNQKQQGPELDVFRGAPTPATPPPVIVPSITVPPAVTPVPASPPQGTVQQPAPTPQTRERTAAPTPTQRPNEPTIEAPPAQQAAPAPSESPPPQESRPTPAPEPAAPLRPANPNNNWIWLAGTAAFVLLVLGALLFRRRNRTEVEAEAFTLAEEPQSAPAPPAPKPDQPAAPAPAPISTDRPWIDLMLEVRSARFSLMGATINYALTVHNRGEQPAEDILIRSLIANADTEQQALLQQFFTGSTGLPVHSMVSVAPGESQNVTGELRLLPDQIAPVKMGDRTLLIPLVAFDAQYRWGVEDSAPTGNGRTGRAFIIGQEQTPPTDRLSPFRLDLGPRQFRAPASRATALTLAR